MDKAPIDIMLASDARGAEGIAVAVRSAIETASRPVRVWIIEDAIPPALQRRMEACWADLPNHAGTTFRSMGSLPLRFPGWWLRKEWPLTSCARFCAAELLPADTDRCVYLDYDTLVGTDLAALVDVDLRGAAVGMVPNTRMPADMEGWARTLGLDPARYCNAGVILIDVAAWRREDLGRKLIAHGSAMPPNIWFMDQDMLNSFFRDRLLLLDERWNLRDAAAGSEGNVLHFAGDAKPWKTDPKLDALAGIVAWRRVRAAFAFHNDFVQPRRSFGYRLALRRARIQRKLIQLKRRLFGAPVQAAAASTFSRSA